MTFDPMPADLPPAGDGYEYRNYLLEGTDALATKGFLRSIAEMP